MLTLCHVQLYQTPGFKIGVKEGALVGDVQCVNAC
jgi:hypothetical protein